MAVKTHQSVSNRMRAIDNNGYTITTIQDVMGDFPVQIADSQVMLPMEKQSNLSKVIQTHNAVSVGVNSWSLGTTWIDADGFDKLGVMLKNDASTNSQLLIQWSNDGVSNHGDDIVMVTANSQQRAITTEVKARYFKFSLNNGDGALAHTMSAWANLKA